MKQHEQQAAAFDDLSAEIAQQVEREPGDLVRCTYVGNDNYRCNWWSIESTAGYDNPAMKGGQIGTTHRIRQSRFLRARRVEGRVLLIEAPIR